MRQTQEVLSALPGPLAKCVRDLRFAVASAISDLGGDPQKPRELARKLGVDKTLAWKISNMLAAGSEEEALQFLPGDAAMDLFVEALGANGDVNAMLHVQKLVFCFREAIATQIGDRHTLDIVLDSLPGRQGNRFLNSRKLAFRGNSGIWGVQARARIQTAFFFPSVRDPELIDIALIAGWVDFRRLRSDAKWVLFRHSFHQGAEQLPSKTEPLDPWDISTNGLNLLREYCSDPAPTLRQTRVRDEMHYQLFDGPLGNAGVFTCFMGSITRGAGRRIVASAEEIGRVGAMISAPVENLQFDLYLHRDIPITGSPFIEVVSGLTSVAKPDESDLLPMEEPVERLSPSPDGCASPVMTEYTRLLTKVHKQLRMTSEDFHGYRYLLKYPPFPSTVRFCVPHEVGK